MAIVGNITTYTDMSVKNGKTYYYIVSAVNSAGEGARSAEACARLFTFPSSPQDLIASVGNGQVQLAWKCPKSNGWSPIINYNIYRGTSPGNEVFLATIGNITTFIDKNVTNGQSYYYKVSAINGAGEGPQSNEATTIPSSGNNSLYLILLLSGIIAVAIVIPISVHVRRKSRIARRQSATPGIIPVKSTSTLGIPAGTKSFKFLNPDETTEKVREILRGDALDTDHNLVQDDKSITLATVTESGMLSLFEPVILHRIHDLGIADDMITDVLELLKDVPQEHQMRYLEDLVKEPDVDGEAGIDE